MRTAIELRAGRAASGAANEEFVADLRRRLAAELDEPGSDDAVVPLRSGRRRVLQLAPLPPRPLRWEPWPTASR